MKKIINGKMYNTETANMVGYNDNNLPRNDFGYCVEMLYKKKTGEFFIYGIGGALSKYSKSIGLNQWSGSETIIPLSENEAKKWAENNLDADEYIEIFGKVEE